ncbi:hypothetical protein NG798_25985 [Ancylothrix sp. C2]|nr:hypothetical protein [Ancylothrix sp. D3o]MCT7953253.1 hypothetical protein [Ancylothrix sp. D3o]
MLPSPHSLPKLEKAIIHRTRLQKPWLVTRYANHIAVGDSVLIWQAGEI